MFFMELSMTYQCYWHVNDQDISGCHWTADSFEAAIQQAQEYIDSYSGSSGANIIGPDNESTHLGGF